MSNNRSSRGFVPLQVSNSDIPLTQIQSSASSTRASSTGVSMPGPARGISFQETEVGDNANVEAHDLYHSGRRRAREMTTSSTEDELADNELSLNAMGRLYDKIFHASVTTRYLVYIVPIALLLAIPLIVLAALNMRSAIPLAHGPNNEDGPSLFLFFLWIEICWLALWVGKLVAWFMAPAFMFFTGVISPGTRKYASVLRNLQIPLSLFFWALAGWLVFINLLQQHHSGVSWVNTVAKLLGATFVSSAIFLGEKTFLQLISISYHQRSFANRIHDSKRAVHLLSLMYDASRKLFPMYCEEFRDEDETINHGIEVLLAGGDKRRMRNNRKSGRVMPARLIGNVGRFGSKVTSAFGNIASEITGKQVFNPNSAHSIVIEALEKKKTSEALARRIWMSFVVEGNNSLLLTDIQEVLGQSHIDVVEECLDAMDADGNGDISLDEMMRKVVDIGKERKSITKSMQDIGQALSVFDNILLFIVLLLVIFVFLAFFQSTFITTLATAGTALLSLSFVFAVTTQEFLGSCIFLFVKHPYDVGDRVDIVGPKETEPLIVEQISLLYTVFTRIDKMQVVQVPNIVLNTLWIENISRSKAMKEVIDVSVAYTTTFEDIELLRLEMEKFIQAPENARDFQSDMTIGLSGVGNLDKLMLTLAIKHKSNWHDETVRANRRSKFICALAAAMKKVPIYSPAGGDEALGGPNNPSYSVTVSDAEAIRVRDKVARNKDSARLVPMESPNMTSDRVSAQDLNMMSGAAGPRGNNRDDEANRTGLRDADGSSSTLNNNTLMSQRGGLRRAGETVSDGDPVETTRNPMIPPAFAALGKSMSQRSGLRRAGETVPDDDDPVDTSYNPQAARRTAGSFDEEAQVGGPNPFLTSRSDIQLNTDAAVENRTSSTSTTAQGPSRTGPSQRYNPNSQR